MEQKVLIPNFFPLEWYGDSCLYATDLGWSETSCLDAQSDNPESVFRYMVEVVGYNVLFFWVVTREWYTIETEKLPVEVRRLYHYEQWDGKYEYRKSGINGEPYTHYPGDVLATFNSPTEIWDNLKIEGVPIGDVLGQSFIAQLD